MDDAGLALALTGVPHARKDQQRLTLAAHDALMLAWLALEGPTSRERLAALLWPASDGEAARNALRQRLFRLRKQLGVEVVVAAGAGTLALAADVRHDVSPGSPLLGDLQVPDAPELDAWLAARRAAQQAQSRETHEARIDALESQGHYAAALPLAQALLQAHPLSEDAHRRVMRLHYLRGDRAAALLAFDACEQMLKHEVGAKPSAATLALLHTIERATDEHSHAGAPTANPGSGPQVAATFQPVPAAVLRPPRLVGRDAELATLQRGLAAGHVVVLVGEAGMGKSRLLQALATSQPGFLHASGRPGDHLVPYATLSRALRQLLDREPDAADAALRQALAVLLPDQQSPPAPAAQPPRLALAKPVRLLLQRAAASVPAMALDDLHFADDATLDLLHGLLAAPRQSGEQQVRWCLGLRPAAPGSRLESLLQAVAAATPHTHLILQPLSASQVGELVESLALPGVQGQGMAATLHQRTGGNPLFALETLKLAWQQGKASQAAELPRPDSLSQLIGQQLSRLSASALQLARVAAVAGVAFSIPLAETLLGRSALDLADAWAELESQQVLRGETFAHDLVHDAVLNSLPEIIARHLHGQAALWLEQHGGEPAHIAAHWESAGQPERALPALHAAAARAHRALREGERIAFLLRAADIAQQAERLDDAFVLLRLAVEAHMNIVRQADGLPLLDRLQSLARTPSQRAHVAGDRAWYSAVMGDYQSAVKQGQDALQQALALPVHDAVLLGAVRQRLGTALSLMGRFDEALTCMQDAAADIEGHAPNDVVGEFHGNLAVILVNLGRPEQARPHHERALALSQEHDEQAQHATNLANYATSRLDAGDVQGAQVQMKEALRIVTQFELEGASAVFIALLQAQCDRAMGRYRAAWDGCEHAAEVLAERNPGRLRVAHLQQAHIWLDLGQHARALQLLGGHDAGAVAIAQTLPARYGVRWLLLQSRLQRRLGATPVAIAALLEQASQLLPAVGWPELRLLVQTEQALDLPEAQALARLHDLAAQASELGLHGAELGTLLHACTLVSAAQPAAALAQACLHLSEQAEALHGDRALRWWAPARALRRAGDHARAHAIVRAGQAWLRDTAQHEVASEFVHGFLHQHPVNSALWDAGPSSVPPTRNAKGGAA